METNGSSFYFFVFILVMIVIFWPVAPQPIKKRKYNRGIQNW